MHFLAKRVSEQPFHHYNLLLPRIVAIDDVWKVHKSHTCMLGSQYTRFPNPLAQ